MAKQEIRHFIRSKKRELTQFDISKASKEIRDNLFTCSYYKNATALYTFVSYNQEVDTKEIIKRAIADGKRVAVPKVQGKEIEFIYISSLEELKEGYQHILEPINNDWADPTKEISPLMLMPGLAFDHAGNRIGYGGGFYDRYLKKYQSASFYKCALGYEFQLFDQFEPEEFDIPVDGIITPIEMVTVSDLHRKGERVKVWNI
ncbi:MAG: 5-formyltetrahydrofolate cyclo-ligase [bacterium]|nr:5-formyltetrahydrofolate cyclo-ligase [bacterium]